MWVLHQSKPFTCLLQGRHVSAGAHAVTLPWLPILASSLGPSSSDMGPSEDQLNLVPAVAEELQRPLHQGVLYLPEQLAAGHSYTPSYPPPVPMNRYLTWC